MVTVTRKWYLTLGHPKIHLHTKFGIPFSKYIGDMHQTQCSFWKQGQRSSSRSQRPKYGPRNFVIPRCIHTPNLRFLPQIILEICSRYNYSKNQVKGQGRSDPKNGMWHSTIPGWINTPNLQFYLKEYRRYAPDTKLDGRTVRLLYMPSKVPMGALKCKKIQLFFFPLTKPQQM